jgi:hypothetical protein
METTGERPGRFWPYLEGNDDMNMRQGALANSAGSTLESTVVGTLTSKGFQTVSYRDYMKRPTAYCNELLLRNVPFTTIYGHPGNTEFLIRSERYHLEIRVECKWQQSSGSVDEKYPYTYLNCIEAMPERDIIIIVDGGGAKQGAVDWLKEAAASGKYAEGKDKCIQMMSLLEFLVWANRIFR